MNVNNVLYDGDDSDLLQQVAAGNEYAFRQLVEQYSGLQSPLAESDQTR